MNPTGDPIDDLASWGVELDRRSFGDAVRDGGLEDENGAEEPKAGLKGWEARRSGSLVLGTTIGAPGKKDGRGLTGAASPGDVMDNSGCQGVWRR
jgi:hypothetical protein